MDRVHVLGCPGDSRALHVTGRIGAIEQQPRRIPQSHCAPLACAYTLVYVQVRQLVIAIKYAYVPPRLFKSSESCFAQPPRLPCMAVMAPMPLQ